MFYRSAELSTHHICSEPKLPRDLKTKTNQETFGFELHFTSDIFCAQQHAHKMQI